MSENLDLDILVPPTEKVKTSKGAVIITLFSFAFFPTVVKFISTYDEQIATNNWFSVANSEQGLSDLCGMITACTGKDRAFLDSLTGGEVVKIFMKCLSLNAPFFLDAFKGEMAKINKAMGSQVKDTDINSPSSSEQDTD